MNPLYEGWVPLEGLVSALEDEGYETLDCEPGRWVVFKSQSPEFKAFLVQTQFLVWHPDHVRRELAGEPPDLVEALIERALETEADVPENWGDDDNCPWGITLDELHRIDAHMPKPDIPPEVIAERMRLTDELFAKLDAMPTHPKASGDPLENLDAFIHGYTPID